MPTITADAIPHTPYGKLIREARLTCKFTQRELADLCGIKTSTVSNMESSPFRVVRRDRLERIAARLSMTPEQTASVLAAYDLAPVSDFHKKQREKWDERNAGRRARRTMPTLERAVVRLLLLRYAENDVCDCAAETVHAPGDVAPAFLCELCDLVRVLELGEAWGPSIGGELDARAAALGVNNELPSTGSAQAVNNEPSDDGSEFG